MFYAVSQLTKHPPSYLTAYSSELIADAAFRSRAPALARSLRVAELVALASLDPDLDSLIGDDAELAESEVARVELELFHHGIGPRSAVVIHDGAFPASARENIIARARLQAFRDAGVTHVFVRLTASGPTLSQILSQPPWAWSSAPPPAVRRPLRPRVGVWKR